ncbi:hypothetical protein DFS33DRAFT_1395230 [Desarmillaria ectypa]|nr:hypothetical protein DFS33DRAFT_1395230 [Desarmillaria ectypa]
MLMKRSRPDRWFSSPSLQVKSSFSVPFIKEVGQHTLKSEPFGLGWIAECSIKVDTIGGKRAPMQSRATFTFYILPNSSDHTSLGDLSFRASFASKAETSKIVGSLTKGAFLVKATLAESDPIYNSNLTLEVTAMLPFRPNPALTSWPRVSKTITSTLDHKGILPVDLKFILCTRMSRRGHIGHPKAIFANSTLLEGYSPYVNKYINTGAKAVDLDLDDCKSSIWNAYDYDADSDFDKDDSDQDTLDIDAALMQHTTDFTRQNIQPAYEVLLSPESPPRTASASVPIDVLDSRAEETMAEPIDTVLLPDSYGNQIYKADVKAAERLGFVWHVNDAAYKTWKALLAYLYTHEISFASLKSSGLSRAATGDACSPKSMYRLAVKADLESLKNLAFENIRSQLTPSNVIAEVFSKFTSQYPKILDMEVKYLVDNFSDPLVYPQWRSKMEEIGRGACPGGTAVMNRVMYLALLERAPASGGKGSLAC